MKILILGGAGMIGQKLARHLSQHGLPNQQIDELVLFDLVEAVKPEAPFKVSTKVGTLLDHTVIKKLAALKPDLVFHLASIVSGEAEIDFDKGWSTNLRATWNLLEELRAQQNSDQSYRPKLIFASSIAVFGGDFPYKIPDNFHTAPQTSYGAQKASIELLVADYSRKGYIDGMSVRVPTICVRPGKANLAASSFFSGIIREPLNGKEADLPVDVGVRHWHASPRSAAGFFAHAASLDLETLGPVRSLTLPGLSCTVEEQIEALRDLAGEEVVQLIKPRPDDAIKKIVSGWPRNFDPVRALSLGFKTESTFKEIIQVYIDEDLPKAC